MNRNVISNFDDLNCLIIFIIAHFRPITVYMFVTSNKLVPTPCTEPIYCEWSIGAAVRNTMPHSTTEVGYMCGHAKFVLNTARYVFCTRTCNRPGGYG